VGFKLILLSKGCSPNMNWAVLRPVLVTSATSVGSLVLLNLLGVLLTRVPKIPLLQREHVRAMSRITMFLCAPCLLATNISSNLTPELLQQSWYLIPWAWLFLLIGYIVSLVMVRCASPGVAFKRHFLVAASHGNSMAMPLVLVETLFKQPVLLERDQDGLAQATTFIFMYVVGWSVVFWGFSFHYLNYSEVTPAALPSSIGNSSNSHLPDNSGCISTDKKLTASVMEMSPITPSPTANNSTSNSNSRAGSNNDTVCAANCWRRTKSCGAEVLLSPPIVGIAVGCLVGLVPSFNWLFYSESSPIRPVTLAAEVLGKGMVTITSIVMMSSLGTSFWKWKDMRDARLQQPTRPVPEPLQSQPQYHQQLQICDEAAEQDDLIQSTSQTTGDMRADVVEPNGGPAVLMRVKVILTVGRMLVIPAAQTAAVMAAATYTDLVPQAKPLRLVLFLEACVPSANLVVVASQLHGQAEAAEHLSQAYLLMNALSVVTMTAFVANALHFVYD